MEFFLDYPSLFSLLNGKIVEFDQPGICEAFYWSPDSRHFTAHCSRDNVDSIYLFSSEDYSTMRVEESGDPSPDVMWSPDSQSFMTSYYVNNAADLYLFSLENNSIQRITEEGRNSRELEYVSWSPDGKWIAYDYGVLGSGSYDVEGLHIMDTECFSDPSTCVSEGTGIKVSPPYTWSPDSRYLAGTTTDNYTGTSVINVLQVNNGALKLSQTYSFNSSIYKLLWSPSGKK
jgi:Tol biopolymer transport system component